MAIEKTTTENGVRTFHTAGKYCDQDIIVTTNVYDGTPLTETKTVALDMASGDQVISKSANVDGMTQVTVTKPATLLAENIKDGVTIGGVTGSLNIDTETKSVSLDMANGDQVVSKSSDKIGMTQVTVTKPANFISENIRAGQTIGGVVGTLNVDVEEKTVALDMSVGNQVVTKSSDKIGMTQVTVEKPSTLIDSNILAGVNIGGVVGSLNVDTETKTVSLDFSNDAQSQVVTKSSDKIGMTSVTIERPNDLLSANILAGKTIAGVAGSLSVATETKTVALDMSSGDQVITKSSDKVGMTSVTVEKPATLVAGNIKSGVTIGGVAGSYAPVLTTKTITENGTYAASSDSADGYSSVTVNVSGGGGGSDGEYTVIVVDYDGTVLKQEKLDTGDTFTLPSQPSHSRLVFQSWSSPVAITNNTVTVGDSDIVIGAVYTTSSGLSEFDIVLTKTTGKSVTFTMGSTSGVTVNWGDGTITTDGTTTHTYADYGEYTITCDGTSVPSYVLGTTSTSPYVKNYTAVGVYLSSITAIPSYAFFGCYSIKTLTIPSGVTAIGDRAFQGCNAIKCIIIPTGVTSIETQVFYACFNIKYIVIPNGVTSMGDSAFYQCCPLTSITIPSSVTTMGNSIFAYCYSLTSITIPSSVTTMGNSILNYCVNLRKANIHSATTGSGTTSSTCITQNCRAITDITVSPTSIGDYAFYQLFRLSRVTIQNGVTTIGNNSFGQAYCVTMVKLPSSLTTISHNAFCYWYNCRMYDFTELQAIPTLSNTNAFNYINEQCKIVVPDSLYSTWITRTNWVTYAKYIYKASEVQ